MKRNLRLKKVVVVGHGLGVIVYLQCMQDRGVNKQRTGSACLSFHRPITRVIACHHRHVVITHSYPKFTVLNIPGI
jgi:hypothetical protein